ncbi:MAG: dephospho-CoA kinase [Flavobacteriaceae bacterium]|nr:dephospho-CoA kinase [Flavobacteriaceae bacterium]
MKIVGLTGGIGSGKTTVATMFNELNVPVYIADIEAKKLTNTSKVIRKKLTELLGTKTYLETGLNKKFVANKIFNDTDLLQKVNAIIHPEVAQHFNKWVKKQEGTYCIKEAAILFENEGYKDCDFTILVTAPLEERIHRVLKRDKTTKKDIENRINNQWSDTKKSKLADLIIENIKLENTQQIVIKTHLFLLKSFRK